MKKRYLCHVLCMVIFCSTLVSGCIYAKVKLPLDTDVSQTQLGKRVGRSSVYSVLWLVAWGDAGVAAAAENGNIRTINHLDTEHFSFLFGLYSRQTTIAYGD